MMISRFVVLKRLFFLFCFLFSKSVFFICFFLFVFVFCFLFVWCVFVFFWFFNMFFWFFLVFLCFFFPCFMLDPGAHKYPLGYSDLQYLFSCGNISVAIQTWARSGMSCTHLFEKCIHIFNPLPGKSGRLCSNKEAFGNLHYHVKIFDELACLWTC